jgi:hypothetical protein
VAAAVTLSATRETIRTRALLACGVLAGPVFVVTAGIQVLTRGGFDLGHHPISLLSLGDLGWIQIANFIVAGAGLIAGGVFVPDPALGYPRGTPDEIPDTFSWHGTMHAFAPVLAFLELIVLCFVFARRFRVGGQRGWSVYSASTGIVCLVLSAWPGVDGSSVRLAVAVVLGFSWLTAFAPRLRAAV